jgi:hypothetical protein
MKVNEGNLDRIIRVVLGLIIIGIGIYNQSWWGAVGLLPLLTGLMGYCALYSVLGINTCPRK